MNTRRPDHPKETQTEVLWTYLPFIGSGRNHLARHRESGKTRQREKEVGRQHQGMDRPGVRQDPEGSGEETERKMEETGSEVICGAPTTLVVKGQMKPKVKSELPALSSVLLLLLFFPPPKSTSILYINQTGHLSNVPSDRLFICIVSHFFQPLVIPHRITFSKNRVSSQCVHIANTNDATNLFKKASGSTDSNSFYLMLNQSRQSDQDDYKDLQRCQCDFKTEI